MRVLELSNHPGTTCHPSNGGELATSRCGAKFPSAEGWRALRDGVVTIIENNIPERYHTQMPTATGVARGVVQSTTGGGNTLSRAHARTTPYSMGQACSNMYVPLRSLYRVFAGAYIIHEPAGSLIRQLVAVPTDE